MKKLILISTLFISYSLTAQIVHTDLVPDSIYFGNYTAHVDMDNNNNPDFAITGASVSGPNSIDFIVVQSNSIGSLNYVLNTGTDVTVLAINTPINAAATTWFQLNTTNPSIATFVNSHQQVVYGLVKRINLLEFSF